MAHNDGNFPPLLFWMFGRGSTYGPNVQRQPNDLEIHQSWKHSCFSEDSARSKELLFQQSFRTISCPKHKVFGWTCKMKIWISLKIHPLLGCFELGGAPLFGKGRNLCGIWMFVKCGTRLIQQPRFNNQNDREVWYTKWWHKYKMVLYLNKKPYTNFHGRILGISTQQNVLWYVFLTSDSCVAVANLCVFTKLRSVPSN